LMTRIRTSLSLLAILSDLTLSSLAAAAAPAHPTPAERAFAADMLRTLVEVDTTAANGTRAAVQAVSTRLVESGYSEGEVEVLAPQDRPTRANVVVRLKGSGRGKPLLIIGHLDVVEAPRQNWTFDPFALTEKDGFFYGRGVLDMKGEDTAVIAAMVRMKRERFRPDRDIVAAFTADEEAGTADGVEWLLKAHPDLMAAGLAINPDEGAAGIRAGQRVYYGIQTSTKRYVTYRLETTGKSGHTAIPQPDNAIYKLAAGLTRLGAFQFPIELDDTTRAYFGRTAGMESGQTRADMLAVSGSQVDMSAAERLAAVPERNANLRTTCVATLLKAGTVENALADSAQATVQCRVLPGDSPDLVRNTLVKVLADPGISVTETEAGQPNPASSLTPEILARVESTVHSLWPGMLVIPSLNIGASDSVYTRAAGIPTYGLCSIFYDLDDDRAHGNDERIGVENFYDGVEFMYRLLKAMSKAGGDPTR
ncbi:MAG TPA: M20/M25/M40 family metallo-hydrolase, partial [Steroidobacteraceae bacterium]|nr:M20/M25/M40 family metallo-hydrolase [Steroidobacteraceae bacterium]